MGEIGKSFGKCKSYILITRSVYYRIIIWQLGRALLNANGTKIGTLPIQEDPIKLNSNKINSYFNH